MNIKEYVFPASVDKAYELLQNKGSLIIGGGLFLQLENKNADIAIDLAKLKLDYIEERDGQIQIGAMTTLRMIETNNMLKNCFNGVLSKAASTVMGVQVRNTATIGGTICGRYGFSDILTVLLALDAYVELYKRGKLSLEEFLETKSDKDVLMKIIIGKESRRASYLSFRNNSTDFSILNTAVAMNKNKFTICVGARPMRAVVAYDAMKYINIMEINEKNVAKTGVIASEKLQFGSDMRASAEYRRDLCKVLVKRCIMEVLK